MSVTNQQSQRQVTDTIKMKRNTWNSVWYNDDTINQIAIQLDANDIFNGMTPIIDISIATSVSISLTNRFDGIKLKLGKVSEYECGYVNNVNTITTTNTWYKIHIVTFTVKLFLTTILLGTQWIC